MFQKLYNCIFSQNIIIRTITWSIIVIINAIPWFILAEDYSILWKIYWIITWILIYVFIYPFFWWGNSNWRKSMCVSYLIHTLTSIFIGMMIICYWINYDVYWGDFLNEIAWIITWFDLIIGIISVNIIVGILWFSWGGLISTYLTTIVHASILSIILLCIAWSIFWISRLWKHILVRIKNKVI